METQPPHNPNDWWLHQRPNYRYVVMAAGILCFLSWAALWETFFADDKLLPGQSTSMLFGILGRMGLHLIIWIPYIFLLMWGYRLLPPLDRQVNPRGVMAIRRQVLIVACVTACLLSLLLPGILVMLYG